MYCRCYDTATGEEFAVKKLSVDPQHRFPYLLDNELHGLAEANFCDVPRVVELVELTASPDAEACVILESVSLAVHSIHCELYTCSFGLLSALGGTDAYHTCLCRLVHGVSVHRYLSDLRKSGTEQPCDLPQHERHVTETAAQLLQVR